MPKLGKPHGESPTPLTLRVPKCCRGAADPLFPKMRRIKEPKVLTFSTRPKLTFSWWRQHKWPPSAENQLSSINRLSMTNYRQRLVTHRFTRLGFDDLDQDEPISEKPYVIPFLPSSLLSFQSRTMRIHYIQDSWMCIPS